MKIALLTSYFGVCPYEFLFMGAATEYCTRHSYNLISIRGQYDVDQNFNFGIPFKTSYGGEPWIWWYKQSLISTYLPLYDYVLWIDMDCLLLNMSLSIQTLIEEFGDNDLLVADHRGIPDTGLLLFRNSVATREWVRYWIEYGYTKFATAACVPHNNHAAFESMYATGALPANSKVVVSPQFGVGHGFMDGQLSTTLAMHVYGTPIEEKVQIMAAFQNRIRR